MTGGHVSTTLTPSRDRRRPEGGDAMQIVIKQVEPIKATAMHMEPDEGIFGKM
jgi:hypothetical protein